VPCSVAPGRISLAIGLARARQAYGTNTPGRVSFVATLRIVSSGVCVTKIVALVAQNLAVRVYGMFHVYRRVISPRALAGRVSNRIPIRGTGRSGLYVPYSF
jgi:hypothetical protein